MTSRNYIATTDQFCEKHACQSQKISKHFWYTVSMGKLSSNTTKVVRKLYSNWGPSRTQKGQKLYLYLRSCKKEEIHSFLQQYSYNLDCFEKAVLSQAWKIFPKTLVNVYPGLNALRGNIF